MAVSLTHKIKPLSVKVSVSHTLQLGNGTVCHPPHFRVHIRPSGQHPRHRPAAVRSEVPHSQTEKAVHPGTAGCRKKGAEQANTATGKGKGIGGVNRAEI